MTITLRDGSRITIRPVEPDDRRTLAEGFERLSAESRYRRFFAPMPELSERALDYLTRVDHHDHEALVAVDPETGDGVGVARYVRIGPGAAEPAIVVADDWQGRGVGSRLVEALAERARDEGIRRFEAPVLASNQAAMAVLEQAGTTTRRPAGREVELVIELPPDGGRVEWRTLLGHFARGAVEPARSLLDLVWPRRRGEAGQARRNVIVVGTDGSDHAAAAVEAAAELAGALDATVELVAAHRLLPPEHAELGDVVREAGGSLRERGLQVHEQVRRGDPALVLTDVAGEENARLIVVGAGGRRKTTRRLIGSVSDFVAERSPCDVLIVRLRT